MNGDPSYGGQSNMEACRENLMSKEQLSLEGPHLLLHGLAETRSDWESNGCLFLSPCERAPGPLDSLGGQEGARL